MSCYFRHLQGLFEEANITVNPNNKKRIDQTIHQVLGAVYKDCPTTWKALKPVLANAQKRSELIRSLHAADL
jgi:hypothetical protein